MSSQAPIQLSLDFYEHGTQLCVKAKVAESLCRSPILYQPDTAVVIEKLGAVWVLVAALGRFDSKCKVLCDNKLDATKRKRRGVTTGEVSA